MRFVYGGAVRLTNLISPKNTEMINKRNWYIVNPNGQLSKILHFFLDILISQEPYKQASYTAVYFDIYFKSVGKQLE